MAEMDGKRDLLEQRLDRVIREYLEEIERGESPDQEQLLIDNPEIADDLKSFFEGQRDLASAIGPRSSATSIRSVTWPCARWTTEAINRPILVFCARPI